MIFKNFEKLEPFLEYRENIAFHYDWYEIDIDSYLVQSPIYARANIKHILKIVIATPQNEIFVMF